MKQATDFILMQTLYKFFSSLTREEEVGRERAME